MNKKKLVKEPEKEQENVYKMYREQWNQQNKAKEAQNKLKKRADYQLPQIKVNQIISSLQKDEEIRAKKLEK